MVAKISSSSSLGSALSYNINKVAKGKAEVLSTNKIFCPADGAFKTADVLSDFETFMPLQYRTENPTFHVSLNPHPDDDLSDAELLAIAEEYIERMGYGAQPYLIFKHEDKDAQRGNYTAVMLFNYAEQHAEDKVNEIKDTHDAVYQKRHTRILEKITAIETAV